MSDITKALLESAYGDFFKFTWHKDIVFGDEVIKGYLLEINHPSQKEL